MWLGAATHDPLRGEVRPWVYKIALNTARSEMARKRHRTPHVSIDEAGLDAARRERRARSASPRAWTRSGGRAPSPWPSERLPDFMREVVVLRCSRELTFAEIAEVTGAPEGTLKSRFHRAVAALREALGPEPGRAR